MEKGIGIIGHVGHGKTTLAAAIINTLANTKTEAKTIHEIIEEDRSIPFNAPPIATVEQWDFKSGKEKRRKRRANKKKA